MNAHGKGGAVTAPRRLPAKDRPGRQAWLGPVAMALGLLSWVVPGAGIAIAGCAVACAGVSMLTGRQYRIDWAAATGAAIGAGQVVFSLLLLALSASGH